MLYWYLINPSISIRLYFYIIVVSCFLGACASVDPKKLPADPPLRILYSKDKPNDDFISVQLHDHWYDIEQNDGQSKRNFSFLQLLLNLAENNTQTITPTITVPTN